MSKLVALSLLAALSGAAACRENNPYFKSDASGHDDGAAAGSDAGLHECSPACTGPTPVCNTAAGVCRGCIANGECPSDACLIDGECIDPSMIAYVSPAHGSGIACTMATPCPSISLATAVAHNIRLLDTDKEIVTVASGSLAIIGDTGVVLGPPTSVTAPIASVNNATLVLSQLELTGGLTDAIYASGNAVLQVDRLYVHGNTGIGINSTSGTFAADRVDIRQNTAGGLSIFQVGNYQVRNALIVANGSGTSAFGGVSISQSTGKFSFATVVANLGQAANINGIDCGAATNEIDDSIVYDNFGTQFTKCAFKYSDVGGGPNGNTNTNAAPLYDTTTYQLQAGSPAIDTADPAGGDPYDLLGVARPQGAGSDMGAYEYKP